LALLIYAAFLAACVAFIYFANRADERQTRECAARSGHIVRGGHMNRSRYCLLPNGELTR
jgi:hypothetical protein